MTLNMEDRQEEGEAHSMFFALYVREGDKNRRGGRWRWKRMKNGIIVVNYSDRGK